MTSAAARRKIFLVAALAAMSFGAVCAAEPVALSKPPSAAAPAAARVPLAVHKAVYELTLLKSLGTKGPTSARGRIAFDFSGSACEGYSQNFRQLTELQPAEGAARVSDMHSATFEDGNDTTFAFSMHTVVDNGVADVVDGRATRASDGSLSTSLTKPVRERFDLDPDVVFPTAHLQRILAAAAAGQKILQVKVYDGSETGQKVYETTAVIGKPTEGPAVEKAAHIPELDSMRRWPVSISYFEGGKKDEPPSYTLSFDLYENGISRALRLDYGDFVLAGEMTSLELLPTKACSK